MTERTINAITLTADEIDMLRNAIDFLHSVPERGIATDVMGPADARARLETIANGLNVLADRAEPAPPRVPTLKDIEPATLEVGGEDTECEIKGTNFTVETVLVWNGTDDVCTFINEAKLSTIVKASLVEAAITVPFHVRNGDLISNELTFTFTEAT